MIIGLPFIILSNKPLSHLNNIAPLSPLPCWGMMMVMK